MAKRELTSTQTDLVTEATRIRILLAAAADQVTALQEERTATIRRMAEAGMSWAEIGRHLKISPQAAMYATGHATRQAKQR